MMQRYKCSLLGTERMKVQKKNMELIDQRMYEEGGDIIVAVMRVRHRYEEKNESF